MKKSIKALAIFAGAVAVVVVIGLALLKTSPSFYRPPRLDAPEFEASARRMEDKLIDLRNIAAEAQSAQARGESANTNYVVTITQDELNAFVLKWAELNALRDQYERYLRRPMVAFEPGRVIFAAEATVGPADCVVSLHARVKREGDRINLAIDRLQAGRVPLPASVWSEPRQRLVSELQRQLPGWQAAARFDRAGAANETAAEAMYGQLLLSALTDQPADARAIIPVSSSKGIAVRIVDLQVDTGQIRLTMKLLSAGERATYLSQLKAPK